MRDQTSPSLKIRDRSSTVFTYANVLATVAVFISLGGASYAAITLPAESVGQKQLRPSAVGLGALSFSLGSTAITDSKPEDLTKNGCNGGGFLGNAAPPCTPPVLGGATPGREVHVHFRSSGRLSVLAITSLKNEGGPQTTARITLRLNVDRHRVAESQLSTAGGQLIQAPIQTLASVSKGSHTAGLAVSAEYSSSAPGDIIVVTTSIVASALPGADATK
jgi:hypothetical protein